MSLVSGDRPGEARPGPRPETRAEAAVPTPRQVIPDGCNMGMLLRVAVGVNLAGFAAAVAQSPSADVLWTNFLRSAALLEPAILLTLVFWCLLRRGLPPLPAPAQRIIAWATPVLVTWVLLGLFGDLTQGNPTWRNFVALFIAAAAGIATQHYVELRARAFSPAMVEAKFQALQSRIRPHFFFNSLNAVLAVIRADPARAERMLENISELFRAVMGDVRKLVPIENELDLCRKYVEIEQTRLGERLAIDWQVGAIHPKARIPQLLLQPIIENAVRYGAEKVEGHCDITVRIKQNGMHLEIFVSNPIAREPIQREGNQIGLTNIRGRLALIYDLEASLVTRVRRDRFELTMTLPVENKH